MPLRDDGQGPSTEIAFPQCEQYSGLRKAWCQAVNGLIRGWDALTSGRQPAYTQKELDQLEYAYGPDKDWHGDHLADMLDRLEWFPDDVVEQIRESSELAQPWGFFTPAILAMAGLFGYIDSLADVGTAEIQQEWARELRRARPNPVDAWQMWRRGYLAPEVVEGYLADLGYPGVAIEGYRRLTEAYIDPSSLIELLRRGKISEGAAKEILGKQGYSNEAAERVFNLVRTYPDSGTLVEGVRRGTISRSEAKATLTKQGLSSEDADVVLSLTRSFLDTGSLTELVRRGVIGTGEFKDVLQKTGLSSEDADKLSNLVQRIPPAPDLIQFAVREAWRDDVAQKYGLDQDYVPEFGHWLSKQGYSEDWARKYWRAHWELPSIYRAREILWRTDFSEDDFKEYLRFADVPARYRDWLTEAVYRPYTRVDVRRMHKLGVLSDQELVQAYRELGYDDEKAANMAEFTIRYNTEEDRQGTKTDILRGYREGLLTREESVEYLQGLGYTADWARYYVSVEDRKRQRKLTEQTVDVVEDLYVMGEIQPPDVYERLGKLNLTSERIARYLESWEIDRAKKVSRPTKSELERLYREGIIDDDRLKEELDKRGYTDEYIGWYYEDLLYRLEQEAIEAEREAREEQQEIEARRVKTAYQVTRADINVQINTLKRQKAEDKRLLLEELTPEQAEALVKEIKDIDVAIASLRVEKAEARREYLEE